MLLSTLLAFFVGLAVMLIASQAFLNVIQELAAKWRFSPLFISLVIVALGTNLPELTVTGVSLYQHDADLAMANLIGSSIANITLIFGIAVLFNNIRIGTNKSQKNAVLLLAITVLFVILLLSSVSKTNQVIIFVITISAALLYQYLSAKEGRLHEDKRLLDQLQKLYTKKRRYPNFFYAVMLTTTISGLAVGGLVTVNAVNNLAHILGYATSVLGLTLTAVSTSLPELLLSILASRKNENKVVIGTLVGSNIFNLALFPAIVLWLGEQGPISNWELYSLLIITIFFSLMLFMYKGRNVAKKVGFGLIAIYLVFVIRTLVVF
ncbi:MAG: sodium:calcium antiporter [Pseudomonadales bacterium]|nr:sodium:calcium antiporter [Candidatus Woesebacteria bacterium]MCB9800679.1 sodium:calcium antiporter [Pseudomonadales bacterium]